MRNLATEILVIGGGATGTGILRDLAMRGFRCMLVEKRDLAHGTTGRYHGLLHSGGRYVVKDPQAARECIEENRILRQIIPFCIEDTGGYFVITPNDDLAYAEKFILGCHAANIPVEDVNISQMLKEEPLLNPGIQRCFRVPDASADSFLAAQANIVSAQQLGAQTLTYHEVRKLILVGNRITGALCYDLVTDELVQISADLVINAAGAWAGKIAGTVGIPVQIKPGKGTMLAINHRILNTVVNRCKMPSDGDIIVPAHTVAVIGTTDEQVTDPDHFSIEPWEIQLMLEEGEKLVPGLREMRILRAWAGVRPLYQEENKEGVSTSRDITRAYVLLDHATRDGIEGLLTITSGKWTTYRLMAEATVNKVCEKLKVQRPCRTHQETIPSLNHGAHYHWLGGRLAQVEQDKAYGSLICECELASESEVIQAITQGNAHTIDDIRRDTRLGMGPCQGGFCTLRVAGLLHQYRKNPAKEINASLRDFLQERWKGVLPILWGQQLRQERLDEFIYLNVLNVDHLPGAEKTRLASENYSLPQASISVSTQDNIQVSQSGRVGDGSSPSLDTLIIGAGLSGLAVTWRLAASHKKVRCVSKGWGSHYWASGCIDVLGYTTQLPEKPVRELLKTLKSYLTNSPNHPYSICGVERLKNALETFQALTMKYGYPMEAVNPSDILEENWLLPNTVGALRPTCLAPVTMVQGNCNEQQKDTLTLFVGFKGYLDFFPQLAADNLNLQGFPSQAIMIDLPELRQQKFLTSRVLAQMMEREEFREKVAEQIRTFSAFQVKPKRLGLPAILGLRPNLDIWQDMQERLDCPIFELPGLPPSIPGMRLHQILKQEIETLSGQIYEGMLVVASEIEKSPNKPYTYHAIGVQSEAAARLKAHRSKSFVLATGGILGGGVRLDPPQMNMNQFINEGIFNLPLSWEIKDPENESNRLIEPEFISKNGHAIFNAGVKVDPSLRPIGLTGEVLLDNVTVIGNALAGFDAIRERSLEGIALMTAFTAANNLNSMLDEGPER